MTYYTYILCVDSFTCPAQTLVQRAANLTTNPIDIQLGFHLKVSSMSNGLSLKFNSFFLSTATFNILTNLTLTAFPGHCDCQSCFIHCYDPAFSTTIHHKYSIWLSNIWNRDGHIKALLPCKHTTKPWKWLHYGLVSYDINT